MNQEAIGKFISELRRDKNMTQETLGTVLGVTNRSVSRWENGVTMPDLSLLSVIADVLDVSVTELLNGRKMTQDELKELKKSVDSMLEYYKSERIVNKRKLSTIFNWILTLLFVFVVGICLLVDFLVNTSFSWSLIVLISMILFSLLLVPFINFVKKPCLAFIIILTLSIFPYLYTLGWIIDISNEMSLGYAIAVASLSMLWIVYFVFVYFRNRVFAALGVSMLLSAIFTYGINVLIDSMIIKNVYDHLGTMINIGACLIAALVFFILDYKRIQFINVKSYIMFNHKK